MIMIMIIIMIIIMSLFQCSFSNKCKQNMFSHSVVSRHWFFLWRPITVLLFENRLVTDLSLDSNNEKKIRVNFNITMMDIKCEYATIDLVSSLGTEQNVTQHISKYNLDAEGVKRGFHGRNRQQNDLVVSDSLVTETLEELHENGEDAVSLDEKTLDFGMTDLLTDLLLYSLLCIFLPTKTN